MLIHLLITDFAVVKTLELDFSDGMTVITGETGAGKSILLNALSLVMGERSDTHWVRPECDKAEIAATFDIAKLTGAILWLTDAELLNQNTTQECIIRRIIYKNGRSKALINGKPVTSAQLRLLGENLLQIHGQHQHQLLLKPFEQLRLLDAFGQHQALLSAVRKAYEVYEDLEQEIRHLRNVIADAHRISLLEYQLEELEQLEIASHECEDLCQEQRRLSHAQSHLSSLTAAFEHLQHEDAGVMTLLQKALVHLQDLTMHYPKLQTVLDLLQTAQVHVEESGIELNRLLNIIQLNPERLQEIEIRLSKMYAIARKHKVEPSQLRNFQNGLSEELTNIKESQARIGSLAEHLELTKQSYKKITHKLTKAREKAALHLAQEITHWFAPLGLKGASFRIDLEHDPENFSLTGLESVQYLVS
ncbi:MAG TPA: AAA family ATPase, partial [Gammaproteobacteria bacterium]|nr:AAA family ATPase [Gammaproteobacteria bacterium]